MLVETDSSIQDHVTEALQRFHERLAPMRRRLFQAQVSRLARCLFWMFLLSIIVFPICTVLAASGPVVLLREVTNRTELPWWQVAFLVIQTPATGLLAIMAVLGAWAALLSEWRIWRLTRQSVSEDGCPDPAKFGEVLDLFHPLQNRADQTIVLVTVGQIVRSHPGLIDVEKLLGFLDAAKECEARRRESKRGWLGVYFTMFIAGLAGTQIMPGPGMEARHNCDTTNQNEFDQLEKQFVGWLRESCLRCEKAE